ncbi:MAG: 2-methylfumaryl-CoA isomerase [Alphaproteobacteria bacterium]|nr:2-methylfumaryl-CoA isomerase [Alphaproteobacteria bacterium]
MTEIIKGLRLVEVSAFIAAPYAGLTLAQMGADVIRIDPVGGGLDYRRWPVTSDNRSLYWAGLNKGKRSIMLNVREAEGRELAHALMTKPGPETGIVLTNLPARGWLDYEGLKTKRDDLIMLGITGNRDGSVALDYTVNAAAGFPSVTGPEDHSGPVNHVMPVWDVVAGLSAANGILTAERHRRETGQGQFIGLALADTAFSTLSHLGYVGEVQINGDNRPATGNQVYGTFGCDFATSDGRRVMITAFTPRHWQALLKATGMEARMKQVEDLFELDLRLEEARWEARDTIIAVLKPWFSSHSLGEIRTALDDAGACWGPYQTFAQAVQEDSRLSAENPMFEEIDQPNIGRYLAAGPMLDFGDAPRTPVLPAPVIGGSTDEILAGELGLGDGEIGKLHDAGIVAGAMP